jgi:hypothetical protein
MASAGGPGAAEKHADRAPLDRRPAFHSRHIPIEHLRLESPMGRDVVRNGLCDTIRPDVLKRLRDMGVQLIEMRVVWWEIEPESGRFDWARTLRDMDAVLDAGLKVGMLAWLQYPPPWYDPTGSAHARFQALGGGCVSSVLSLWDPMTLATYDRLLGIIAEKLKGRLSFVYNAISGNYGEVVYSLGAKHYRFSSRGTGSDYWAGDRCARASFARELRKRYGSPERLSTAWGLEVASWSDDLMPQMPFRKNSLRQRDDYMQWCTGSIADFADRVCGLYQRDFPGVAGALPIGFVGEGMAEGQVKSRSVKLAAKYGLTSRWTGCAQLGSFDRSHLPARRIASAAQFYGSPFGTEAALILNADNAADALYESLANGSSMIHDDPQNIFRAAAVHKAMRPKLIVDPPVTSIAVFYPVESEMLQMPGFAWDTLDRRCAQLRRATDYDICDTEMIRDGYLATKSDLVFLTSAHLRDETAGAILAFAADRGRVWLYKDAEVAVLYRAATLVELAAGRGLSMADTDRVGTTGLYRFDDWRQIASHAARRAFAIPDRGEFCYHTLHRQHESCYFPEDQTFEVRVRG